MKRSIAYIGGCLGWMIIILSSCQKTLDVPSSHLVPAKQMWQTKNDARSALFATYGLLRAALANNNAYLVYGELRAGDFQSTSNVDVKAVIDNKLNATSSDMEAWKNWRRFYATIAQANLCLDKLPLVHENDFRYTEDELRLDQANVRFIRALTYFFMVRIWGDVPLVTGIDGNNLRTVERTDRNEVLDFVVQEAELALQDLPWQYNNTFPEQKGQYWNQSADFWKGKVATKTAAYALLAHVAAWRGDYFGAARYLNDIITNQSLGGFDWSYTTTLTSTSGGVFMGESADIIFFLSAFAEYQEASNTGHIESWTMAAPYITRRLPVIYIPNDTIIGIFNEQEDERFYIDTNDIPHGDYFTGFGNPVPLFSKVRLLTTSGEAPLEEYQSGIVIFRYEEIELLQAEAMFFLGETDQALQWLNTVRNQRGLADYSGSVDDLGTAILQERRRELLGEGWRWYDLIRFGRVNAYTGITDADIQQGALFWPLAKDVLTGNPKVEQSPFWQH